MFRAATLLTISLLSSVACLAEERLVELGRDLFFDTNLSEPRGQACATCHDPERAFAENRDTAPAPALSPGADGVSLVDRNAPTLTYAALIPPFQQRHGHFTGGFFLDGRAATLNDQALEPLLNPLEMGQPTRAALADRILEDPRHRSKIAAIFGQQSLASPAALLEAVAAAITAWERSMEFARFDSRYDRSLRGEYTMTREEAIGRELFFSDLINCVQCHLNDAGRISPRETFTNHRFHNIGVPVNEQARRANGLGSGHRDPGLAGNSTVADDRYLGQFRVPTLRNVAVTAPYMHNGVFETLEAAVAFYGQYPPGSGTGRINPETGRSWRQAEVPETVDLEILGDGQPIDAVRVRQLVAFLKTLTDRRYERHLH